MVCSISAVREGPEIKFNALGRAFSLALSQRQNSDLLLIINLDSRITTWCSLKKLSRVGLVADDANTSVPVSAIPAIALLIHIECSPLVEPKLQLLDKLARLFFNSGAARIAKFWGLFVSQLLNKCNEDSGSFRL